MRTFAERVGAAKIFSKPGDPELVQMDYKRIIAVVGATCTEVVRERLVEGRGVDSVTTQAYHEFIYPPQASVVLTSSEDERNMGRYIHEDKDCPFNLRDVLGHYGVELDMTASPPRVDVFDLLDGYSSPRPIALVFK